MKLIGSKQAIRSPEFHKKKVIKRWLIATAVILIVLVVVVGPILLLRLKKLRIADVQIVGNDVTKTEDIETLVAQDLSGDYLKVIPKDSAVFYPKNKIKSDLLTAMPRLASVVVSLTSPHALKIVVTERQPEALYCADKCYFIDSTGYIFAEAPDFSDDVYMKYAVTPELDTPVRTQLYDADQFKKIEKFIDSLKTLGIEPEELTKNGDEYDLTEKAGPIVKWSNAEDLDTLFVNLDSFINNSGLKMADIETMQYIDLRFDNKVFYK